MCEGAPCAKIWTTCFAFAGKGGALGVSEEKSPAVLNALREDQLGSELDWPGPAHQFPSQTD